jgi:hypothetical protein
VANAMHLIRPKLIVWSGKAAACRAATLAQQAELEALVRRIVAAVGRGEDVTPLEAEVNERVYRLFGLSREEIAIIEEPA